MGFVKGKSGNPAGRPVGARNKTTRMLEALLDGEAEAIGRMLVTKAKKGDLTAARVIMDRILPARRDRQVAFALPILKRAEDGPKAIAALVQAVAEGSLTPSEAAHLSNLVAHFTDLLAVSDIEARLAALENERKVDA